MTFADGIHEVELWLVNLDPLPILWTEDEIKRMEQEKLAQNQPPEHYLIADLLDMKTS